MPELAEWAILSFMGIYLSFVVGFIPFILVSIDKHWGHKAVHGSILVVCLILILTLWANSRIDISPIPAFFQTAGVAGTILLFLWPVLKFMGTAHDPWENEYEDAYEDLILYGAVDALLRRGEMTFEQSTVVIPWAFNVPDLSSRLQQLPIQVQLSIEREMSIERSIRKYGQKHDVRGRGQKSL